MNYSSKGFTLVEVALSVAVGLIIIGGTVLMWDAVKSATMHKTGNSYIITVPQGNGYSTYYTSAYTEKDNCIQFKDTWGNNHKVCGSYQVQGP